MKHVSIKSHPKLSIALIILAGVLSSSAYAASTIITDTGITTTNLTVTGTCSGCGGSGSFSNWGLTINETVAGTAGWTGQTVIVGNDGSVFANDVRGYNAIILINGTVENVLQSNSFNNMATQTTIASSVDAKYKVEDDVTNSQIHVYKNNVLIQTIGIRLADFESGDFSKVSLGMSSDGKYISIYGSDTTAGINRVVIFTGS